MAPAITHGGASGAAAIATQLGSRGRYRGSEAQMADFVFAFFWVMAFVMPVVIVGVGFATWMARPRPTKVNGKLNSR